MSWVSLQTWAWAISRACSLLVRVLAFPHPSFYHHLHHHRRPQQQRATILGLLKRLMRPVTLARAICLHSYHHHRIRLHHHLLPPPPQHQQHALVLLAACVCSSFRLLPPLTPSKITTIGRVTPPPPAPPTPRPKLSPVDCSRCKLTSPPSSHQRPKLDILPL
jgi:hypothetical protein